MKNQKLGAPYLHHQIKKVALANFYTGLHATFLYSPVFLIYQPFFETHEVYKIRVDILEELFYQK